MKKIFKFLLLPLFLIGSIFGGYALYNKYVNHYFAPVTEGKVYRSSFIPNEKLVDFLKEKKIKTVIDLREGMVQDELNPETKGEINLEKDILKKHPEFNYYNLPTLQIPEDSTVNNFIKIMENKDNYPVLIHCYHGVGRAVLFSAIYKIEFENVLPEDARKNAKPFVEITSFSKTAEKGMYLTNYKKRRK